MSVLFLLGALALIVAGVCVYVLAQPPSPPKG
jgi:hypothetical protein